MQLTRRGFFLLLMPAVMLAMGQFAGLFVYLAPLAALGVFTLLAVDFRRGARLEDLAFERRCDSRLAIGMPAPVRLVVVNRGARALRLVLRDDVPESFNQGAAVVMLALSVGAQERCQARYEVTPTRRGRFEWRSLAVRVSAPWGLVNKSFEPPLPTQVRVTPNLEPVKRYLLLSRRGALLGMGLRLRRHSGPGMEIDRLREHEPDDDLRCIDWSATARRSKLITREFESERNQEVMLVVDHGRLMNAPLEHLTKLEQVITAAVALSHMIATRGDRVGLLTFGETVTTHVKPGPGRRRHAVIATALTDLEGTMLEANHEQACAVLHARQRRRALVVMFTDFVDRAHVERVKPHLTRLCRKHLVLLVTVTNPVIAHWARSTPQSWREGYRHLAAQVHRDEKDALLRDLNRIGARACDFSADALCIEVMNRYLEWKRVGRLTARF